MKEIFGELMLFHSMYKRRKKKSIKKSQWSYPCTTYPPVIFFSAKNNLMGNTRIWDFSRE